MRMLTCLLFTALLLCAAPHHGLADNKQADDFAGHYTYKNPACTGDMTVTRTTYHVTLDISTACGQMGRTCTFKETIPLWQKDVALFSKDDFLFATVFQGKEADITFLRGFQNEYCGMNATFDGRYVKSK